jgi:hypothetical protein
MTSEKWLVRNMTHQKKAFKDAAHGYVILEPGSETVTTLLDKELVASLPGLVVESPPTEETPVVEAPVATPKAVAKAKNEGVPSAGAPWQVGLGAKA